jgi:hypothetical protein
MLVPNGVTDAMGIRTLIAAALLVGGLAAIACMYLALFTALSILFAKVTQ